MRKPISQQMGFGDGFNNPSLYELDEELKKVDEFLCNPQLLKPFEEVFDEILGRPGTPVGIYLRMMYLTFRWGLSYEEVQSVVPPKLPPRGGFRLRLASIRCYSHCWTSASNQLTARAPNSLA